MNVNCVEAKRKAGENNERPKKKASKTLRALKTYMILENFIHVFSPSPFSNTKHVRMSKLASVYRYSGSLLTRELFHRYKQVKKILSTNHV